MAMSVKSVAMSVKSVAMIFYSLELSRVLSPKKSLNSLNSLNNAKRHFLIKWAFAIILKENTRYIFNWKRKEVLYYGRTRKCKRQNQTT